MEVIFGHCSAVLFLRKLPAHRQTGGASLCCCLLEPWCDTTGSQTNLSADSHSCMPLLVETTSPCESSPPPKVPPKHTQILPAPWQNPTLILELDWALYSEKVVALWLSISGRVFLNKPQELRCMNFPLLQQYRFKEKGVLLFLLHQLYCDFLECTY